MRIEFELQTDLCILHLKGRFVTGSDADLLRAREALQSIRSRKVVADCRDVPYIDSTGVSFLVALYKDLMNAGGGFALMNVNHRVREVLGITRLDGIIPVFESEAAAISGVRPAA